MDREDNKLVDSIQPSCVAGSEDDSEISANKLESSSPIITLPKSVHLRKANITGNEYGIWSSMRILKGIRFGPYEGITIHDEDESDQSGYSWKVLKEKDICFSMDAKDEHESNWLHYVNFASDQEQQNLIVLQYDGQIYYETIKDISPDTELLVWCGDENANLDGNETEDNPHLCKMKSMQMIIKHQDHNKHVYTQRKSCTSVSYKWKSLEKDNPIYTGEKSYTCDVCAKKFTQKGNLKKHKMIHTGEKPFTCNVCEKKFAQKSALRRHDRTHTGEKPYTCDVCEKKFTERSYLKEHKRIHTGEKPYTCDVCEKKFTGISQLKSHRRIHTGEKPYICYVCEKKFRYRSVLNEHKRMHTGEKPYTCDVCEKKFTQNSNLKLHKRLHTGEKPYSCDICEKKFTRSRNLKQHDRLHIREKPYTCEEMVILRNIIGYT